jgi:DNA-binding LacI/PurR family transcriptional regulator
MDRPGNGGRARPTLAHVAAEAGVSQATVSRALAGSPLVNERTRARVWEVARRLAFEPNRLARSLRQGATMAVGLVIPDVAAVFYAAALKAAQEVLEAAGYHVLVANTERAADRERSALAMLRAQQVDGLIVATSGGYEDIGVPTVFFDSVPTRNAAPVVALDNENGVGLLVEHLVGVHGHDRIGYLGPPEAVGTGTNGLLQGVGRERLEAFRAAVGRARLPLPPEWVRTGDVGAPDAAIEALAGELLDGPQPPRAVVAGVDVFAVALLRALRARGRAVPGDVALVSFDEPLYADLIEPTVTSLGRHDRELGRRAAQLLLDALESGERAPSRVVRLPAQLRARRSCGCAGD